MVSSNILQFTLALYISEKTGVKDNQNSNNFKDKRKNAKDNEINKLCSYKNDEDKKLCSQAKDNACGDGSTFVPKIRI